MADPDYFTLAEFRLLPQMNSSSTYSDDRINEVAAALTGIIERGVGVSFVPRSFTRTMTESAADTLLTAPFVLEVTNVAITAQGGSFAVEGWSTGSAARMWPATNRNVSVTYTAGYSDEPPADIKEALMWAVRDRLMATNQNAGIDARRTSVITDQGTVNYVLPGEDRPTGYPDLDAAILGWRARLFGLGFV